MERSPRSLAFRYINHDEEVGQEEAYQSICDLEFDRDMAWTKFRMMEAQNQHLRELLGRIYGLLPPEDVKAEDGRWFRFQDPDANETLRRLRDHITSIANELRDNPPAKG